MNKILLIDNDRLRVDEIKKFMLRIGGQVDVFGTSEDLLSKPNYFDYRCVVINLLIPGCLDGNQIAMYLRNHTQKQLLPIIGLSGSPNLFDKRYFTVIMTDYYAIEAYLMALVKI